MQIWKVLKRGLKKIKKDLRILSLLGVIIFASGCELGSVKNVCLDPVYYNEEDQRELLNAFETIERRLIECSNQNEKLKRLNE